MLNRGAEKFLMFTRSENVAVALFLWSLAVRFVRSRAFFFFLMPLLFEIVAITVKL